MAIPDDDLEAKMLRCGPRGHFLHEGTVDAPGHYVHVDDAVSVAREAVRQATRIAETLTDHLAEIAPPHWMDSCDDEAVKAAWRAYYNVYRGLDA